MKTTTTLFEYIESELNHLGLNDFMENGLLKTSRDNQQYIRKMIRYDEEIDMIISNYFFAGCHLENESSDKRFKKAFVNRFLNREFMYQTLEATIAQAVFTFLKHEDFLNRYYTNLDQYLLNKSKQENTNNQEQVSDDRTLFTDLPQDNINLNVDNTILDYGTTNTINRNKNQNNQNAETTNENAKLSDLKELSFMLEEIFEDFDSSCFLQIF